VPVAVTLFTTQTPSSLSPNVGSFAQEAKINNDKAVITIFFIFMILKLVNFIWM